MGWEHVEYLCGHQADVQMYGRHSDRDAKVAWMRGRLCPECYAEQERQKAEKRAAEQAAAGLPALQGSDRQVAWAVQVRGALLDAVDAQLARLHDEEQTPKALRTLALGQALRESLASETRASWWIDRRDHRVKDMTDMIQLAREEVPNVYTDLVAQAKAQAEG